MTQNDATMTKPGICGSAPILLVADVETSANYYRDQLGFSYERFWGDPPGFCILDRDNFSVMLALAKETKSIVPHYKAIEGMWNIYFWVTDAESLYKDFKARGASIAYELHDTSYGCREFGVKDIDGYIIALGQNLDKSS